jgi:hypothetical protein
LAWGDLTLQSVRPSPKPACLGQGLSARQPDCTHVCTSCFESKTWLQLLKALSQQTPCTGLFATTNLSDLQMTLHSFVSRPEEENFLVAQQKTCDWCKNNLSFAKGTTMGSLMLHPSYLPTTCYCCRNLKLR